MTVAQKVAVIFLYLKGQDYFSNNKDASVSSLL
jgi:hypothetical protein